MEDDPGSKPPQMLSRKYTATFMLCALWVCLGIGVYHVVEAETQHITAEVLNVSMPAPWYNTLTPTILIISLILAGFSFFFSASEVAFLSLNKMQLRSLRESNAFIKQLIARLMKRPGSLLATILMGNNIVNVLLSITFADPMAEVFEQSFSLSSHQSYLASVIITTSLLMFFCEILPKIFAANMPLAFAFGASIPLFCIDVLMAPMRNAVMTLVAFLFKITRLSQVPAAPFLTDDEFIALLSDSEASGVIEENERQMIQGILEFSDVCVGEILVPRPDIVALKESATAGEALEIVKEHEFARMPVYREDLDHITGILYAKDLLAVTEQGKLDTPVVKLMRKPHFAPETMTVADFVKMAQRLRAHIAIVVDEYGGTEGLVTLQDALREVVGDIGEEDDIDKPFFIELGEKRFRIAGNFPLDQFEEKMGVKTCDEEHTTLGGFLMAQSDKILKPGDMLEYGNIVFKIESVSDKRVTSVLAEIAANMDNDERRERI